jgi:hypothetical protein
VDALVGEYLPVAGTDAQFVARVGAKMSQNAVIRINSGKAGASSGNFVS